ncbi:hypothetical protein AVEN_87809-1 [Araneus ventricosus]|uniref:Uncharacterized protein n=1 Tax=Araneus ventricosus TaxID=182803 RepID=A0A4Y2BB94_ARAVE|nr:hypothetical protein AVEN_87809-1 [Araneus ventricosus]
MSLWMSTNQELTTKEFMVWHCVSQQEIMEESLSEEKEVTAKQQSSSAIREMLKTWETVASSIEKHHPNKAVAMSATNLFYDNAESRFGQLLKRRKKNVSRQLPTKKELELKEEMKDPDFSLPSISKSNPKSVTIELPKNPFKSPKITQISDRLKCGVNVDDLSLSRETVRRTCKEFRTYITQNIKTNFTAPKD